MSEFTTQNGDIVRSRAVIHIAVNRLLESDDVPFRREVRHQTPVMNFEKQLEDLRFHLGGTAILRCTLTHNGKPTMTWLKNSFPVQTNERVFQTFDGKQARLVITNIVSSDLGCYECVAVDDKQKCTTRGTLLLKDSMADSNGGNGGNVVYHQATSENDSARSEGRPKTLNGMEQNEVKRSVLQRLESVRNRCSVVEFRSAEKGQTNGGDLFRKKSFQDAPSYQSEARPQSVVVQRSATTIKQKLLEWCKIQVRDYKGVNITNFSSSWNDGLAFCALIHRFCPDAFDFDKLNSHNIQHNFELAFDVAQNYANVTPLLDVEDMVRMKNPDWKCVFMYVESIYRAFAIKKNSQKPD